MDDNDIAQILVDVDVMNENHDITNFVKDLQHRYPSHTPRVFDPRDPASSISSSTSSPLSDSPVNVNKHDIKRDNIKHDNIKHDIKQNTKQDTRHVRIQEPEVSSHVNHDNHTNHANRVKNIKSRSHQNDRENVNNNINNNDIDNANDDFNDNAIDDKIQNNSADDKTITSSNASTKSLNPNVIVLYGYRAPITTLYFIGILILIAIAIYFLTSNSKKKVIKKADE